MTTAPALLPYHSAPSLKVLSSEARLGYRISSCPDPLPKLRSDISPMAALESKRFGKFPNHTGDLWRVAVFFLAAWQFRHAWLIWMPLMLAAVGRFSHWRSWFCQSAKVFPELGCANWELAF
jgi:hypothetical protein